MRWQRLGWLMVPFLAVMGMLQWVTTAAGAETAVAAVPIQQQVLYDGALGGAMDAQGWSYGAANLAVLQNPQVGLTAMATYGFVNGATQLTTTARMDDAAGFGLRDTAVLDRMRGYTLTFAIETISETHSSLDRAGFSVIVIGDDLLGLEVGIWENEVWVQEGGTEPDLFTHAEGISVATTAMTTYMLAVKDAGYTLTVGNEVLTGTLRDYTAEPPLIPPGFPIPIPPSLADFVDPYEVPNLIFMGDDTSSAAGETRISYVALSYPEARVYLPLVIR